MDKHQGITLDEKGILKNKKRYVSGYLWRGLMGDVLSEIDREQLNKSLSWAKKRQVGLKLWAFAQLVELVMSLRKPRT